MFFVCHDKFEIYLIKLKLKPEFEMKDLGRANIILGMEIKSDMNNCILYLNQRSYVKKILERLSILECKHVSLPIANYFKISSE